LVLLDEINLPTLLFALVVSFVWGAMHALTPGHGKTIVGAYLVGSRGTARHALYLGLATTITHTAGVFALGMVTLFAAQYIVPEVLFPWLSLLSGLLVAGIGLSLFLGRLRAARYRPAGIGAARLKWSRVPVSIGSRASLQTQPALRQIRLAAQVRGPASLRIHGHVHLPGDGHSHSNNHPEDHHHPHHPVYYHELDGSSHTHHDAYADAHDHAAHTHLPPGVDGAPVSWRSLLALGISGGLLPCPSALVVLLSAIALDRIGFGLVLVLAFSLGLAGVLTGIGLVFVYAGRLFERLPVQGWLLRILPAVSALLIALVGLGIAARALLEVGVLSR
jgi:ABC-type nickel/cobalt efflux system permease component RcnA